MLLLVMIFTGIASGSAQIGPVADGPSPMIRSLLTAGGSSCDPSGNIDEVPFEPTSVPIEDWLKERKARQIPMEMRVSPPELRMDQQTAVHYQARVQLKNPRAAQERKVVFFVGVDSAAGERLTEWLNGVK